MPKPFVYDEKTSILYSPEGEFIKKIYCPKAMHWNQLISNDSNDRSRGCQFCNEDVINLDLLSVEEAMKRFSENSHTCAHSTSSSPNVIYLKDLNSPELNSCRSDLMQWPSMELIPDLPRIATARNIDDIKRAASTGFWPDIRKVEYKDGEIQEKLGLYQNALTGEVKVIGDYRSVIDLRNNAQSDWHEVIPVTFYYSNYQNSPFAAYLIPKDLEDGSAVLIPDPIEDILGSTWNQGDRYRAVNVTAKVISRKVIIDPAAVKQSNFMG